MRAHARAGAAISASRSSAPCCSVYMYPCYWGNALSHRRMFGSELIALSGIKWLRLIIAVSDVYNSVKAMNFNVKLVVWGHSILKV